MLRNGYCAWDPARALRASSHVCHVRVPHPRSPLNTNTQNAAAGGGGAAHHPRDVRRLPPHGV
eukprot:4747276-Prymnesium_polylepis.1